MTPAAFERAVESGRAPALAFLAEHGDYRQATSVFPSLTPVCLSSIATGAGPDVHHIPLARLVEPAGAPDRRVRLLLRGAARSRALAVAHSTPIFNMNARHLSPRRGHGLRGARGRRPRRGAVNITCYRGRHRYLPTRARYGPRRLRAAPLLLLRPVRVGPDRRAVRGAQPPRRLGRRVRRRGRALARHARRLRLPRLLPLRLRLRLARGTARTARRPTRALEQTDAAIRALLDAAGGPDEFLERYAVVLLSDHGQTTVEQAARLRGAVRGRSRTRSSSRASNRAGQVYLLPDARVDAAALARRLDG